MKKVDGIKVKVTSPEVRETSDGMGEWVLGKGTTVRITHGSIREGKLKESHTGVEYTLDLGGMSLEKVLELAGSDLRISIAGSLRKTSDGLIKTINGGKFTLVELETEMMLDGKIGGDIEELKRQKELLERRLAQLEGNGK